MNLRKYVPIDMMQLPAKVNTRDDAVHAIRICDRLCTLMDNQFHCVRNDKFLIASVIEHVFVQLVPVPKPRAKKMNEAEEHRARRQERRKLRKEGISTLGLDDKEISKKSPKEQKKLGIQKLLPLIELQPAVLAVKLTEEDAEGSATVSRKITEMLNDLTLMEVTGLFESASALEAKVVCAVRLLVEEGRASVIDAKVGIPGADGEAAAGEDANSTNDLPDFSVGKDAQAKLHAEACIWDEPITRADQVELLLTIQRLMEQFAAACFSIQQTRSFDAVMVCVSGCMCAITDAVLRRRAMDDVSAVSSCKYLIGCFMMLFVADIRASDGSDFRWQAAGHSWFRFVCLVFRRANRDYRSSST